MFLRVSIDEANHIHGTKEILESMTKDRRFFSDWLILKSTVKRKIKQIQSSTRFIGDGVLSLILLSIYFIFGYFVHKTLRTRFLEMNQKEVINLLKLQEADI